MMPRNIPEDNIGHSRYDGKFSVEDFLLFVHPLVHDMIYINEIFSCRVAPPPTTGIPSHPSWNRDVGYIASCPTYCAFSLLLVLRSLVPPDHPSPSPTPVWAVDGISYFSFALSYVLAGDALLT